MSDFKIVITADQMTASAIYHLLDTVDPLTADAMSLVGELPEAPWKIELYFEVCPEVSDVQARLEELFDIDPAKFQVTRVAIPDENWVEKVQQDLAPVAAGPFLVHGSHDRAAAAHADIPIEIDAGEAFGTAHHGTTAGCLSMIAQVAGDQHQTCLDLGTGTGILAIALAQFNPNATVILASDIDETATRIARENAKKNKVAERVTFLTADGLDASPIADAAPFDLIIANILAEPLITLAPAIAGAMAEDGDLILSGLLNEQEPQVAGAYTTQGLAHVTTARRGEWSTLHFHKP